MNVLLVWPVFPSSYWSFEKVIEIVGKKALMPPLGLLTVAGLLPQEWNYRLVDKNVRDLTEDDWAWADVVMLSAMIVQRDDFAATIAEAKRRGLPVAVGGPYATSVPEDAEEPGADYIVMDEGEITIPMFVENFLADPSWRRGEGEAARRFTAKGAKPEMTETRVVRFDLVDMPAYDMMSVQYSRGCPFLCEFCDIINLYGRVPRTKETDKLLAEIGFLFDLGWRGSVFLVDDNFIGNKKNVKAMLPALAEWQREHGNPFHFDTEASVDLAADEDLLDMMIEANFVSVFLGIETPDVDSLELTRKHQNNRLPMSESVERIVHKGMRVMAGFIIGFDNEKPGAGDRLVEFVEQTNVTHGLISMLQVLPNTGLNTRLEKEGRLKKEIGTLNQATVLNFVPTRPAAEIAWEYLGALDKLYDPANYMNRVYRHVLEVGTTRPDVPAPKPDPNPPARDRRREVVDYLKFMAKVPRLVWLQGVQRNSRRVFWKALFSLWQRRPDRIDHFLTLCAHAEHFIALTKLTHEQLEPQLVGISDEIYVPEPVVEDKPKKRAPALQSHFAA